MNATSGFFAALRRHAGRPALTDGRDQWNYHDLLNAVAQWRNRLDDVGARRVAFRLPNGLDWAALDLALLDSGRTAIPVPDFFSPTQEGHALAVSGADALVLDRRGRARPSGWRRRVLAPGWELCVNPRAEPAGLHSGTAKITFTSGTTGAPKGVCLSADSQLGTANQIRDALGGSGPWRHLSVLPLALLLENTAGLYANLGNGNAVCVPDLAELGIDGSSGLDAARFVGGLERFDPQSLILVPQLLLALTAMAEFGLALPGNLRFVAVGGGRVSESLLERASRAGIPVYEGYGLTECGSVVTLNRPGACRPGTVGRPLPGVIVSVHDGEVMVRGRSMLGYLGEPPAPATIRTGDHGAIDEDGYLRVRGRAGNVYSTAFGRNINPEWIESELVSELAIGQAVVFGESLPGNVAVIVPRGAVTDQDLDAAVSTSNSRLPDYARVAAWRRVEPADFRARCCLTDNGRPRRTQVARAYRNLLDQMFIQVVEDTHP